MRAAGFIAVLALLGVADAARAQALPAPPYQADPTYARGGEAVAPPPSIDRYGGYHRAAPPQPQPQPGDAGPARYAPSGPTLAWVGKVEAQAQSGPAPTSGGWTTMSRQWNAPSPPAYPNRSQPGSFQPAAFQAASVQGQAPQTGWRPYPPQDSQARPAPTSIYDPPAAPAQPQVQPYRSAQAQAAPGPQTQRSEGGPRFYSLHRDYGLQPDAIPLPPQFFGPTADLSAPVTDPLARRTTTVNGQTRTVAVPDPQGDQ